MFKLSASMCFKILDQICSKRYIAPAAVCFCLQQIKSSAAFLDESPPNENKFRFPVDVTPTDCRVFLKAATRNDREMEQGIEGSSFPANRKRRASSRLREQQAPYLSLISTEKLISYCFLLGIRDYLFIRGLRLEPQLSEMACE